MDGRASSETRSIGRWNQAIGEREGKEDESEKRLEEDRGEKIGVEASPHPGPGLPSKLKINTER